MSLPMAVLLGLVAVGMLIGSAERAVASTLEVLRYYRLSATFGGLTIMAMLTSLPELVAHFMASLGILTGTLDYQIASATVLGANIGSDVVQQTLVLGIVVLMMGGMQFDRHFLRTAYLPMIGTTLMTLALAWDRTLSRLDGLALLSAFLVYNSMLYRGERVEPEPEEPDSPTLVATWHIAGWFVMVLASAHVLLMCSEVVVEATGLGGSLIGVVVLGVAAAAPEMVTAISGFRQGKVGLSLGTLIGSNITNPLVAIGGGAVLSTYAVPDALVYWDLPAETGSAALLLAYLWLKPRAGWLGRGGGVYLVVLYVVYLVLRVWWFPTDF